MAIDRSYITRYSEYAARALSQRVTTVTAKAPETPKSSTFKVDPYSFENLQKEKAKDLPSNLHAVISDRERVGARLYIIKKDLNGSWGIQHKTNKFFLTSMGMGLKEKVQISETFGATAVSFFDNSVKIYEFGGMAIETPTFKTDETGGIIETDAGEGTVARVPYGVDGFWGSSLIHLYENQMRGTKLVANNAVALLTVGTHYVYGYPVSFNVSYAAQSDPIVAFQMAWIILEHTMSYDDIVYDDFASNYAITGNPTVSVTPGT